MSHPKVSIIILNWNGWKDTIECLESLYQITYPNYDVIVVDNGSRDESIGKIKEYCEGKIRVESKFFEYDSSNKPIKIIEYTREEAEAGEGEEKKFANFSSNRKLILIKNEKNALKTLNPDYILLLNNDTVVDKRFLDELVKDAESNEKIGIAGPVIYLYKAPNIVQSTGGRINMWTGRRTHVMKVEGRKTRTYVDFVSGACLLIKRIVIKKIGLLDTEYFAYLEDIDWCVRARECGYTVLSTPSSLVWHKGSMSTGGRYSPEVLYYLCKNGFLFMKKYARIYHIPTFIIISGYYFIKRLLISTIEDPKKTKYMIMGALSILKRIKREKLH